MGTLQGEGDCNKVDGIGANVHLHLHGKKLEWARGHISKLPAALLFLYRLQFEITFKSILLCVFEGKMKYFNGLLGPTKINLNILFLEL